MHVIVLKYVQVLCITIFFSNNINCDKLLLHNEREDQDLYRIGACTAACMTGAIDAQAEPGLVPSSDTPSDLKGLVRCYRLCSEDSRPLSAWRPLVQRRDPSLRIRLICRDNNNLIIQVAEHDAAREATATRPPHLYGKSGLPAKVEASENQLNALPSNFGVSESGAKQAVTQSGYQTQYARSRRAIGASSSNHRKSGLVPDREAETDTGQSAGDLAHRRSMAHPIYLVKVQASGEELGDRIVYMSNASLVKIENLSPNKRYNVTATMLTSEYEYFYAEKEQFRTLPLDYQPGTIIDMKVEQFVTNAENNRLVDAVISWIPAKDKTCHYEILYHATHSTGFHHQAVDVQQPEVLYRYTMEALELNSNYMVAIRSKNTQNMLRESQLHWQSFYTPNCAKQTNGSQICAPEPIENIRVVEKLLSDDHYKVNISWDRPEIIPDYYIVRLFDLHGSPNEETANSISKNVSGEAVGLVIDSFEMFGPHFEVLIAAYSSGGISKENVIKTLSIGRVTPADTWIWTKLVFIILSPVLLIGLLKISVSLVCRRRAKLKRNVERCEYFKELEQKAPVDPSTEFETKTKNLQELLASSPFPPELTVPINDELEIDGDHLMLHDLLGEGAFGLVRKGVLHPPEHTPLPVAVKMLKDCPRVEDIIEFRREMEVMKSVGTHPHIVSIVGHCTKNVRKMMLLTEYCGHGNLLNYLRTQWQRLQKQNRANRTVPPSRSPDTGATDKDEADGDIESGHTDVRTVPSASECLTPALSSDKMPENVFNFDTSFVNDKKSFTYKNFSDQKQQQLLQDGQRPVRAPQIIENKLYTLFNDEGDSSTTGDHERKLGTCTNACKNVVEIVDEEHSCATQPEEREGSMKGNIKIKPCSCPHNTVDGELTQNSVENRCYHRCPEDSENLESAEELDKPHRPNSDQLLEFSRQIALGMEYLARNKVVHRDLAARNVLVCSTDTVKIADFGLSRDIYQENLYRKTSNGKLPIKWLALESMTHQVYTSQSDVWSYGILLYEICTLGGSPYPSISTSKLLRYLESGYRMERPKSCSEELYALMYSCWNLHPGERPTFTKIVHTVEQLQERTVAGETSTPTIDLNAVVDSHCSKSCTEENSYLKPVEY
ncbi:tyrosine-protein kinase receptor torso [Anopheles cruzii]|uniref:tyrosine-protein kinase receptor torso n=1 Tax=Anopheles cruzii TaxID=68878 RepID=UPI0022EC2AF6|nr:tyrosine-protein kinase receptor torso [Anopheles cruzii]